MTKINIVEIDCKKETRFDQQLYFTDIRAWIQYMKK